MDNKDFDKIFSDGLGEEQGFDFRESDWDEVAASIQQKPLRGLLWWKWLLPLLLLICTGVIYCLFVEMTKTKDEANALKAKVLEMEATLKNSQNSIDTIYRNDTIYIREGNDLKNSGISGTPGFSTQNQNEISNTEVNIKPKSIETSNEISNEELAELTFTDPLLELELKETEIELNPPKQEFYLSEISIQEKQPWFKNKLKIGLTSSLGVTESAWGKNRSVYNQDSTRQYRLNNMLDKNAIELGLRAEFEFYDRWRVLASISANHIRFNSSDREDFFGKGLFPESDLEGELSSARFRQTSLNYSAGVKYLFEEHRKWIFYSGFSLQGQFFLNQNIEADYTYVYQLSNTKTASKKGANFDLLAITPFAGCEFRFTKRWSWQMEAWYKFNFLKENDQIYPKLGIRNTVLYHF